MNYVLKNILNDLYFDEIQRKTNTLNLRDIKYKNKNKLN